jgi:hypothetical protein
MYFNYLNDILGKSTLYKILTDCAATVRKSVEGLDNFIMEGSRAFQALDEMLEDFHESALKKKLLEAKRYLKTDFKVCIIRLLNVLDGLINIFPKFNHQIRDF